MSSVKETATMCRPAGVDSYTELTLVTQKAYTIHICDDLVIMANNIATVGLYAPCTVRYLALKAKSLVTENQNSRKK
jgi:hypothetical protein